MSSKAHAGNYITLHSFTHSFQMKSAFQRKSTSIFCGDILNRVETTGRRKNIAEPSKSGDKLQSNLYSTTEVTKKAHERTETSVNVSVATDQKKRAGSHASSIFTRTLTLPVPTSTLHPFMTHLLH